MTRGPRSTRRLTAHRVPAAAPAYREGGPVVGLDQPRWEPRRPVVGRAPVDPRMATWRRALRRRAWAWRLLLAGWLGLTGLALWAGLRWAGPASLGCPGLMLAVLLGLAYVASSDLREHERELRAEG
ncbi:hypothetical protein AB0N38_29860 [Micromonospora aurantiaca]|uniref:hypothetical protein n=1 Tax=Micromonospora aurantiaca (nom. illeg.) TaxID=47850 RepID=UPI001E48C2C5|nr:hypothetical protein [Micromonospora aurantiaca]UFN92486.1 hypothetical protein LF814_21020 [Micromonospora aurantiaca]